jgi:hypothetical protein
MPTLESRIATLERQNHFLRTLFAVTAIALVTCGGVTSNYELVNTNQLVIVDHQNQPKITLSSNGTITFQHPTTPVVLDANTLAKLLATQSATAPR